MSSMWSQEVMLAQAEARALAGTPLVILNRIRPQWPKKVEPKPLGELTALMRKAMGVDEFGKHRPMAPLSSLGQQMVSIIPRDAWVKKICVLSDLSVLAATILELGQRKSDAEITYIGHTDEQVAFAKGLGVKATREPYDQLEVFFLWDSGMKFDVVIGNPPYQKMKQEENSGNANASSARPIYQDFHAKAEKDFNAKVIIMVVPAKCLSGGSDLGDFLPHVLKSRKIHQIIHRHANPGWFPGVGGEGGNIVYHWDREYQGQISFTTESGTVGNPKIDTITVDPSKYDILLMDLDAMTVPLLDKVLFKANGDFIKPLGMSPYGFSTDHFTNSKYHTTGHTTNPTVMCAWGDPKNRGKPQFQAIPRDQVKKNLGSLDHWKIITAHAGRSTGINKMRFMSDMFILGPGQICTHTYIVLGTFATQAEALNMKAVIDTAFYQWLAQLRIVRKISPDVFKWIPKLDWTHSWTTKEIYDHFGLTDQEIAYVENYMKHVTDKRSLYER